MITAVCFFVAAACCRVQWKLYSNRGRITAVILFIFLKGVVSVFLSLKTREKITFRSKIHTSVLHEGFDLELLLYPDLRCFYHCMSRMHGVGELRDSCIYSGHTNLNHSAVNEVTEPVLNVLLCCSHWKTLDTAVVHRTRLVQHLFLVLSSNCPSVGERN